MKRPSKEMKRIARDILNDRYGVPMGAFVAVSIIVAVMDVSQYRPINWAAVVFPVDENNPAKILSKGYSVTLKDGRAVSSVKTLASGDKISIVFGDGTANAAIVDTEVKNEFRSKT